MVGPIVQTGKTEAQRGEFWSQKSWLGSGEITMEEAKPPRAEMKANLGGLSQMAGGPFTQLSDLHVDFACPFLQCLPPPRAGPV